MLSLPILFLVAAVVGVVFTLNALRPARRFWPLVGAGFFASWLTGELALHNIFWQAILAGVFVWAGALAAWPGWVALGLLVTSWIGLGFVVASARRSREVMDRALGEGLGADYLGALEDERRALIAEPYRLRQRIMPFAMRDRRVEVTKNIVFSELDGVRLKLDVYAPRERRGKCPTVLFVHGGAWMLGSKDDQGKPMAYRLAAHGWVVVSINYRLSPRFAFPAHIIDVKSAIRWIREHAAEHGADPDFLVITGGSAGGHLAALAALTPNDPAFQPGFEEVDTKVQACVPFYGVYDFTDRKGIWKKTIMRRLLERVVMKRKFKDEPGAFEQASPMSHVGADAPPFFVVHGMNDTIVPVAEARLFVELLKAVSKAPVLYAELPGAQHAFEVFPSERATRVLAGVETFLGAVYVRWRDGRAVEDKPRAPAREPLPEPLAEAILEPRPETSSAA